MAGLSDCCYLDLCSLFCKIICFNKTKKDIGITKQLSTGVSVVSSFVGPEGQTVAGRGAEGNSLARGFNKTTDDRNPSRQLFCYTDVFFDFIKTDYFTK